MAPAPQSAWSLLLQLRKATPWPHTASLAPLLGLPHAKHAAHASTSAPCLLAYKPLLPRPLGRVQAPAVSTSLSEDVTLVNLLMAKPGVQSDLVDTHRSEALGRVQAALRQQGRPQQAEAPASAECELPSLKDVQSLPAPFLRHLVHQCRLDPVPPDSTEGSVSAEDSGEAAALASAVHQHLSTVVEEAQARSRRGDPAVWRSGDAGTRSQDSDMGLQPREQPLGEQQQVRGGWARVAAAVGAGPGAPVSSSSLPTSSVLPASLAAGGTPRSPGSADSVDAGDSVSSGSQRSSAGQGGSGGFSWGSWGVIDLSQQQPGVSPMRGASASRPADPTCPSGPDTWLDGASASAQPSPSASIRSNGGASSRGTSTSHPDAGQPPRPSLWAEPATYMDPKDPYAPLPDQRHARQNLFHELTALLRRQGSRRSPLEPANLMVLRPAQLALLAEDCGLPFRKLKHHELAASLAGLLAQQQEQQRAGRGQGQQQEQREGQGQGQQEEGVAGGSSHQLTAMPSLRVRSGGHAEHAVGSTLDDALPWDSLALPENAASTSRTGSTASRTGRTASRTGRTAVDGVAGGAAAVPAVAETAMAATSAAVEAAAAVLAGGSDPRAEVLAHDALVRAAALAVQPAQVVRWLSDAHALDVMVLGGAGAETVVVATATSQRHAYACGEAVRSQAREVLEEHRQSLPPLLGSWLRLPKPQLVGGRGMDWVQVQAGNVVAHILTERARRFYNLEGLYGLTGPQDAAMATRAADQGQSQLAGKQQHF